MGICFSLLRQDEFHRNELMSTDFKDLERFSYKGIVLQAKVTEVYDGDTVIIVFFDGNHFVKYPFRLFGFDSPEMKMKKGLPDRDLHKSAARVARDKLSELLETSHYMVWIRFSKIKERYGRLMGDMFLVDPKSTGEFIGTETCVNDWMIKQGFGKKYDGGKKQKFSRLDLQKIMNMSNVDFLEFLSFSSQDMRT